MFILKIEEVKFRGKSEYILYWVIKRKVSVIHGTVREQSFKLHSHRTKTKSKSLQAGINMVHLSDQAKANSFGKLVT